jgi:poly-gamma-glutamate synthesis protein (capsule biosynthesis protein)
LTFSHWSGTIPFDPEEWDYQLGSQFIKQKKAYRKLVEKGADLVICQHSHCIGCEEKYQGGTIVYGQGNFLFDGSERDCWQTSLLISLNEKLELSYVPLKKTGNAVRLAEGEDGEEILSLFAKRSEEIMQDGFIEKTYAAFSADLLNSYLFHFSGIKRGFFYRVIDKLSGHRFTPWLLKRRPLRTKATK